MYQQSAALWSNNPADPVTQTLTVTAENAAEAATLAATAATLNARAAAKTVSVVGNSLVIQLTL